MLHRQYPRRVKGISQISPVKGVRLSPEAAEILANLTCAMEARWGDEAPSISMLINKALVFYADRITYDPQRLEAAYEEFVEESQTRRQEEHGR